MTEQFALGHAKPVAKKAHVCDLCSRTIDPGERYERWRQIDYDWGPQVWKQCAHCSALWAAFSHEWDYDQHEGYNQDHISEWVPETDEGTFAKACWLRRWRAPDGTLDPIPERVLRPGKVAP